MIPDGISKSEIDALIDEWIIGKNAELAQLMKDAPNDQIKQKLQTIMTEM